MLLHQFDPNPVAIFNPTDVVEPIEGFPKVVVSCFARTTFQRMVDALDAVPIASVSCATVKSSVYKATYNGVEIGLFQSYVGSAGCIATLEDLFTLGAEKLVLFGTCGVLDRNINDCSVIIPTSALRDEGTSFHYAPPSDEIPVNPKYIDTFTAILDSHGCSYTMGKVWTTDAIYRETRDKANLRKADGCICVDMECSAVAAFAQFRKKEVFHFFYAADNLDHETWDRRSLANGSNLLEKDRIAQLALELAAAIS